MHVAAAVALAMTSWSAAKPAKLPPVEGPPSELVREVVKSLEASAVERVPLEKYASNGIDAVAGMDRCLAKQIAPPSIVLTCSGTSLTAPWPPKSSDDIATLLSNALRLVDPEHEIRTERERTVARALSRATDDPFTAYLAPELVAAVTSHNTAMFGATPGVEVWPRDPTKVREVRRGSDAARAGIEPGDRILSVDDASVVGLTFPEIAAKLQGANDSIVRFTMKTQQGEKPFNVARSIVPESDVQSAPLDGNVLYIMLPVFKQGIADKIKQILWETRPSGVILDLRHDGGGYVPEATQLADLFLKDGVFAGTRAGPGRPTEDYTMRKDANDVESPLVVLVDGGTASASELFAMGMKDRKRAVVIGTQTAGKGSFQRQIHMPDGGVLKVTAGYYVGPTGKRLDENGVTPDRFLAPAATKTVLEGGDPRRDSWVLSALDALQGQRPQSVTYSGTGPAP
jgi:carboxyl-terminal processing protease